MINDSLPYFRYSGSKTGLAGFKSKNQSYWDCLISYLELVLRFVLRQGGTHNFLPLVLLELLFGLFLAAYKNSVSVEKLVPFESTKDLYE